VIDRYALFGGRKELDTAFVNQETIQLAREYHILDCFVFGSDWPISGLQYNKIYKEIIAEFDEQIFDQIQMNSKMFI